MIKNWVIGLLLIIVAALIGTVINHDMRITNLERQQMRIETDYNRVVREAEQLKRMNETNLRLLSRGGWYEVSSDSSSY